jgi:hypothetical protein
MLANLMPLSRDYTSLPFDMRGEIRMPLRKIRFRSKIQMVAGLLANNCQLVASRNHPGLYDGVDRNRLNVLLKSFRVILDVIGQFVKVGRHGKGVLQRAACCQSLDADSY